MENSLKDSIHWQALSNSAASIGREFPLREAFQNDFERAPTFSLSFDKLYLDYSKNWIDASIWSELLALANNSPLANRREKLFSGARVNTTENRPVLHTALRDRSFLPLFIDDRDIMREIRNVHHQLQSISEKVRNCHWYGYSDKYITDVVHIGIGGSHLGPEMVCRALSDYNGSHLKMHFVSNVDFTSINDIFKKLKPETTLFIIASKSFKTEETLVNGLQAKQWIQSHSNDSNSISKHFLAITSNPQAANEFGIPTENVLPMWDWVGGRYSLWSAIGLPIALAIGVDRFTLLLEGAEAMDKHFREAPFDQNMPVILALLGVWYHTLLGINNQAIIPYSEQLSQFPSYLQQCDMESNGKSTGINGEPVATPTGPILWGGTGTNSQHAFFQLLHQGSHIVPTDFIGVCQCHHMNIDQHKILLSNLIAQTEALMLGKTEEQAYEEMLASGMAETEANKLKGHRSFAGNRPSTTLLLEELSPYSLGQLIALYEHKVFCQGVLWQINSFDQWGVELGKQLSKPILSELRDSELPLDHDASSNQLVAHIRQILGG